MPQLSSYLTNTQVDQLKALADGFFMEGRRCACGKPKHPEHALCAKCSRYAGPFVVVESPSGDYVEAGGLESAQSLINRVSNSTAPA